MDEIINLINNSDLTISEYDNIKFIIDNKIKNINKNEYSNNLLINIKNYITNNILLIDLINNITNVKVSYDNECSYIHFQYIDFTFEFTIYEDDDNVKILEVYNKMSQYCFYNNHEENFIKILDWDFLVSNDEIYDFFKYIFNSLPEHLYNIW